MSKTTQEIIAAWEKVCLLLDISEEKEKPFQEIDMVIEKTSLISKLLTAYLVNKLSDESRDKIYESIIKIRNIIIENGFKNSANLITVDKKGVVEILNQLNQIELQFKENLDFIEIYSSLYDQNQKVFEDVYDQKRKEVTDWLAYKTSEDLSGVFKENKEELSFSITGQYILFFIVLVFVCSLGIHFLNNEVNNAIIENNKFFMLVLSKYIFIVPLLWMALFVSRRLVENRKVYHTYLHKEVAVRSYLNYVEYIEHNQHYFENSKETKSLLLKNTISALEINPALLLDKTAAEKIPTEELMMKIIDKVQVSGKSGNS